MKILVTSSVFPDALEQLQRDHDVVIARDAPEDELMERIRDREAVIFRSGVQINADVMGAAPDLRLLIRAGSGLDNVDLEHVEKRGIELQRIPEPGARSVAELAFALMLGAARQVTVADRLLREGHWAKHELKGYLLADKALGVYGAGNIGTMVAQLGRTMGMEVTVCVEWPTPDRAAQFEAEGIRLADSREVLATSDFLSIHLPLKDATRNILGAAELAQMKPGAFLINLARGGVVNEQALLAALLEGRLAGAGIDVHENEGEGKISPLVACPNVILTPHIGAATVDSQRKIGERILEIVDRTRQPG